MSNNEKLKIEELPFVKDRALPKLVKYEEILYTPEDLGDINKAEGTKLENAFDKTVDDSDDIPEGATNKYLVDLSVTKQKLANAAVAWEKLEDEAVHADKVYKSGAVITLSAQIKEAVILNAHIGNAEIQAAKIGSLDANVINAGTLTARTVRTQSSGQRVEMRRHGDPLPDELVFYNSAGNLALEIFGGASEVVIKGNLDLRPICFQGPLGHYAWKIYETYVDACSQKIKNLATPTLNYDAATKKYVDDNAGGAGALSELTIDVDKDWNVKEITNLKYIKFNSTYGRIYLEADLVFDFYPAEVAVSKNLKPVGSLNLGYDAVGERWQNIYGENIFAKERLRIPVGANKYN